jgi:hypothetical protein
MLFVAIAVLARVPGSLIFPRLYPRAAYFRDLQDYLISTENAAADDA